MPLKREKARANKLPLKRVGEVTTKTKAGNSPHTQFLVGFGQSDGHGVFEFLSLDLVVVV